MGDGVAEAEGGGAAVVGATVMLGDAVSSVACDPQPVSASSAAVTSTAPGRTRMGAPYPAPSPPQEVPLRRTPTESEETSVSAQPHAVTCSCS